MKLALQLVCFIAGATLTAAPLVDEPVAELKLTNGKTLHDARALSYSQSGVFVKHRDGGSQVPYDVFPEPLQAELGKRRPKPKTAEELAEEEARRAIATEREAAAKAHRKAQQKQASNSQTAAAEMPRDELIRTAAINLCEREVRSYMKAPATTTFANQTVSRPKQGWDYYEVRGENTSNNSYNTPLTSTHRMIIRITPDDRVEAVYLEISGVVKYGEWKD